MNLLHNKILLILLLAAPLSAQQTVVVPDVLVEVEPTPLTIQNTVEVMPDSIRLDRIADALEGIAEAIAECGCMDQGTSRVVRLGQGALVLAAFWIGWQLKRIADNESVTVPPYESDESLP